MKAKGLIGFNRLIISQIGLLILLSISAYRASHSSDSIILTYEIKDKVQNLLLKMANAETFQRGVMITHEEKYLNTYHLEKSSFRKVLVQLREIVEGQPSQLRRIEKIDSLSKRKFLEMDLTLHMEKVGRYDRMLELIKDDYGKMYMDEMRVLVQNLIAEQDHFLSESKGNSKFWNYIILLFFLISLLVTGFSTFKLLLQLTPLVDKLEETKNELKHVNDNLSESLYKYKKLYQETKK
ncbi:MAG: CHASE3 domain sensor protein [Saprospiraceae bacterium]|jgi:CHASE3 domain sensor protein|tara:strand:- start:638 stop:1351 length:714 start_codon:yes stop_codon:yes gene_type:complete